MGRTRRAGWQERQRGAGQRWNAQTLALLMEDADGAADAGDTGDTGDADERATPPQAAENAERAERRRAQRRVAHETAGQPTDILAMPALTRVGYAPVTRVDAAAREVEFCATSEAVDSFGTVFDYDASKEAFTRWLGNVREMHERRAVGRRVAVRFDDDGRRIFVRARISLGAQDTWEKLLDGTLCGASIGASHVRWERQTRRAQGQPREVQVATRYDLVELSLVDSPSNPDALGVVIVRDALPDQTLLDALDDADAPPAQTVVSAEPAPMPEGQVREAPPVPDARPQLVPALDATPGAEPDAEPAPRKAAPGKEAQRREAAAPSRDAHTARALGPFSADPAGYPDRGTPGRAEEPPTHALPDTPEQPAGNARERFHAAARGIMLGCGCAQCLTALALLGEPEALAQRGADGGRTGELAGLARAFAVGLDASVARLAALDGTLRDLRAGLDDTLRHTRSELVGDMSALRARVETLEAQPLPGGPAARMVPGGRELFERERQGVEWRAVEKGHALTPHAAAAGQAEQYRALEALAGRLRDPQAQIAVAAELIRLQGEG